jgi:hypothetical protein
VVGLTEEQLHFVHDLTEEEIKEYLSHNLVMHVSDEHFKKKEDAN